MRKQEIPRYGLLISLIFMTSAVMVQETDATKQLCENSDASCRECITADPSCSWCVKADEATLTDPIKRCKLHKDNLATCNAPDNSTTLIANPVSHFEIVKDVPFTDAGPNFFDNETNIGKTVIQMKPQVITMKLRKGQPAKVNVTFRKVIDYPLDIYYVMDLSYSMSDDLQTLQNLGENLFDDIKTHVTNNIQLGFGSFVDKVMMPFASTVPAQLKNPCFNQENATTCAPPFGFRHQVNITGDASAFAAAIRSTNISGNIDIPEGSFDALMQIAVCSHIQWREGATHVILLTTDASPHLAMDGKLAAILEANDMKCHMERGSNILLPDAIVYSKSKTMDYPSLGQLKEVFKKNKIHSIYAVTADVYDLYKRIDDVLSDAYVAQLKADSSNIIPLINQTYNKLKGRLAVTTTATPANVRQTHRVFCPNNSPVEGSLQCDGIEIGDEVVFELEFLASECPGDPNHRDRIVVSSSSLQDEVTINLEYICECDCQSTGLVNSSHCNHFGSLTCGLCACDSGREGSLCQCSSTKDGTDVKESCKRDGSELYCEGRGVCECGACQCEKPYNGTFCECQTTLCPYNEGGVCGGVEKGWCNNCGDDGRDKCVCHGEHSIKPTDKTCTCHPDLCRDNKTSSAVCNGRGTCNCDACVCTPSAESTDIWSGKYCESCIDPSCTGLKLTCDDEQIRNCARCKNEAIDDCKIECETNTFLNAANVPNFPGKCKDCPEGDTTWNCKRCAEHSERLKGVDVCAITLTGSDCLLHYQIRWLKSSQIMVYVRKFNKERDCPHPKSVLSIALPVVLTVIFIGVTLLLAWKWHQVWRDKRQYEQFQKKKSGNIAMNISSIYKDTKRKSSGYSDELNKTNPDEMNSTRHLDLVIEEDPL